MKPADPRRRMSRDGRSRRRVTAALAGLAALAVSAGALSAPASSVAATPDPPGAPGGPADAAGVTELSADALPPGVAPGSHEVTLITGDRVSLDRVGGDGPFEVTVEEQAPRPAGEAVMFTTRVGPDGVYVLPSDALPAVQAGDLDRELFNLATLVEDGYADAESDSLPLIVTYPEPVGAAARGAAPDAGALATRAARLPAATGAEALTSINGAGTTVAKAQAPQLWRQLRGDLTSRGAPEVWLDRTATLALDESTPLVGAPDAWDAGYDGSGVTVAVLDTGLDVEHPDLVDRVAATESFVDGVSPADDHGHGTHVASTVLGSGAASDGRYVGVAPGAELVSGRVCDEEGRCPSSAIIAGMEWAAREMGADVVNLSLGSGWSDGTDPVSQAANDLTAETSALFVAAAGNDGEMSSVGSPAAADAALAVAATDKSDGLAGFSSRGPRWGDMALKPDIAAPGVNIVAARADGTTPGTPVNEWYTSWQGTSMAAPHVAGTAAILAQAYPDWGPAQLKAALMSTSHDAGHTVYEQGAGRVDVARAVTQQVVATTHKLDYGASLIPHEGEPGADPVTHEVTYRNLADSPVTLSLTGKLARTDGGSATGALTLPDSVAVPAAGTATVEVTLDVATLERGHYSGAVVATDDTGDARVSTPVGVVREPPKFDLTIHTRGPDGQPVQPDGTEVIDVTGPDGRINALRYGADGEVIARVPEGTFSVTQLVNWQGDDDRINAALLSNPEVTVDGHTEITLDVRDAGEITFDTPRPAGPRNNRPAMAYQRTTPNGDAYATMIGTSHTHGAWTRLWASPTEPVTTGGFRFWSQWLLGAPQVTMRVTGPDARELDAVAPMRVAVGDPDADGGQRVAQNGHPGYVPFQGTQELPLVDVGKASEDDLAGRDLSGSLALVMADGYFNDVLGGARCGVDIEQLRRVSAAGAAGAVIYPDPDPPADVSCRTALPVPIVQEPFTGPRKEVSLPNAFVSRAEAQDLRDRLAGGPVTVEVTGNPETSYSYLLKPFEQGRVPESLHYTFGDADLGRTELDYHAPQADTTFSENRTVWQPDDAVTSALALSQRSAPAFTGPRSRTEYFGPTDGGVLHNRSAYARVGGLDSEGYTNRIWRSTLAEPFTQPDEPEQDWFVTPKTPGMPVQPQGAYDLAERDDAVDLGVCAFCRQGGFLFGHFPFVAGAPGEARSDGGSGSVDDTSYEEGYFDLDISLRFEGEPVPSLPGLPWPLFTLPAERGEYELTAQGPRTDATWTYRSGAPEQDSRQPGYSCFPESVLGVGAPCAQEPMVFAGYDLGDSLASDNTVRAPGAQRFDVYAYHAPSAVPMPEIAGLDLWVSYDDGEQWTPARVRDRGNGRFQATVIHPPAHRRTSDSVSLKVEAWDADGSRIEQVTRDAYTLDGAAGPGGPGDRGGPPWAGPAVVS